MTSSNGMPYPCNPEVAEYAEVVSRANTRIVFDTLIGAPEAEDLLLDWVAVVLTIWLVGELEVNEALDVNDELDDKVEAVGTEEALLVEIEAGFVDIMIDELELELFMTDATLMIGDTVVEVLDGFVVVLDILLVVVVLEVWSNGFVS
jgi:hypothetical protein